MAEINNINNKIIHNQLKSIIINLIQLKKEDPEFQLKMKNASELLTANNLELCGQILNVTFYFLSNLLAILPRKSFITLTPHLRKRNIIRSS